MLTANTSVCSTETPSEAKHLYVSCYNGLMPIIDNGTERSRSKFHHSSVLFKTSQKLSGNYVTVYCCNYVLNNFSTNHYDFFLETTDTVVSAKPANFVNLP